MAPQEFQRKLTSILSADVKDYSRLMESDEAGTLRRLNEAREIIDQHIVRHRGRVVSAAGDGVLCEFESPVEAVRCSAAMQEELGRRNAELAPDTRMLWRVGINLGDVMIDGDNIFGDGVNVAARLQSLAEAGGICISGTVYDQVETKLPLRYAPMGEQRVKNIAKLVRVYGVHGDAEGALTIEPPTAAKEGRSRWRLWRPGWALAALLAGVLVWTSLTSPPPPPRDPTMTPAVAVLPFRAIGGDQGQVEFGEGLTEDLIVALAEQTGLRVISAEESLSPQEIGARLQVPYVLDGRVRQAGDKLRITAQLSETSSGYHLWGGRYDRTLGDVLAVQEEVADKIVATLAVKLAESEGERLRSEGGTTGQSYLMRGVAYLGRFAEDAVTLPGTLYRALTNADGTVNLKVVGRSGEARLSLGERDGRA